MPSETPYPVATIRYADSAQRLTVRRIFEWERADVPAMIMSASSGPKDYLKNQIFLLFEAHPRVGKVIMVRASGPPFLLMRDDYNCWFDVTGKQVVNCPQGDTE